MSQKPEDKGVRTLEIQHFVTQDGIDENDRRVVVLILNAHRYHFSMSTELARELVVGLNKALGPDA